MDFLFHFLFVDLKCKRVVLLFVLANYTYLLEICRVRRCVYCIDSKESRLAVTHKPIERSGKKNRSMLKLSTANLSDRYSKRDPLVSQAKSRHFKVAFFGRNCHCHKQSANESRTSRVIVSRGELYRILEKEKQHIHDIKNVLHESAQNEVSLLVIIDYNNFIYVCESYVMRCLEEWSRRRRRRSWILLFAVHCICYLSWWSWLQDTSLHA